MATKRDQLQAAQFLAQRTISALVVRETDPEQPPFKRPMNSAVGGVILTALVLAGFLIFGLLVPGGNKAWEDGKSVIVVKETGTQYVYLNEHLHPVRNYASALLAVGESGGEPKTETVSRNSLAGVPRGPEIGIPDAPDSLPDSSEITTAGWSLCTRPSTDNTGAPSDESVLMVGKPVTGGQPVTPDAGLLVQSRDTNDQYLLWHGYRHVIADRNTDAVGLALHSEPRAQVGAEFVDMLPQGQPLAPIAIPGVGKRSTAVPARPDLRVGQLVVTDTSDGAQQRYLVGPTSLRPITELQFDIQRAYSKTRQAYDGIEPQGVPLGLGAAAGARTDVAPDPGVGPVPATRPTFLGAGQNSMSVCASFKGNGFVPDLQINPPLPTSDPMNATHQSSSRGTPIADQIFVQPGRAALVRAMSGPDAQGGTLVLVTDQGRAFPLAGESVQGMLGYKNNTPIDLPGSLVSRVPMGSGLDPKAVLGTDVPGSATAP